MMNKLLLTSVLVLALFSCTRDVCEQSCTGCVELEQIFYLRPECEAHYKIDESNIIKIEFVEVDDKRALSGSCEVSTGGYANATFKVSMNDEEFTSELQVRGCTGEAIPSAETSLLESFVWNGYRFYFHKLYPRSRLITEYPNLNNYETVLSMKKL